MSESARSEARHPGLLAGFVDGDASERALRTIATGRKAWLFVGSDDSARSASAFFSLIASCKLHGLEPEAYLRDVLRVLPVIDRRDPRESGPGVVGERDHQVVVGR